MLHEINFEDMAALLAQSSAVRNPFTLSYTRTSS